MDTRDTGEGTDLTPHGPRAFAFRAKVRRFLPVLGGRTVPYGIGCAWLGRSHDFCGTLARDLSVLGRAYESGFRYFDTARAYGESERTLGEFLRTVDRSSVFIATKVNLRTPELGPDAALESFRSSFSESFDRLGTDYIDLFQIHDIGEFEPAAAAGGALDTLVHARKQGRIAGIGVATYRRSVLEAAARHADVDAILTYRQYTPLKLSAAPLIARTAGLGKGCINASPLHAGFLTGAPPPPDQMEEHPLMLRWRELARSFAELCSRHGVAVLAAALQFPGLEPRIDITLTGPASAREVEATVRALAQPIPQTFWAAVRTWQASVSDLYEE